MFNLLRQGHVALRGWPKTARAAHARTKAREAAGGGERNRFLDREGHVSRSDWCSGFLSF